MLVNAVTESVPILLTIECGKHVRATVKWAGSTPFQIHTDFYSNLAQVDVTEQHKQSLKGK